MVQDAVTDLLRLGLSDAEIEIAHDISALRDVRPIGLKTPPAPEALPAIILTPRSTDAVQRILPWAARTGRRVRVEGGRSNVVGALDAATEVILRTDHLDWIDDVDKISQTVRCGAGVIGSDLEAAIRVDDMTLGHYPQSLKTSTVGGWIATRATGQASAAYGGIERLVCGLEAVLVTGELINIGTRPRAAGGIDAVALLCGSEGSLAVLTGATLAMTPRQSERRLVAVFPGFEAALLAQRVIVQRRLPVAVIRAVNATESFAVAPTGAIGAGECLLILSLEGEQAIVQVAEELVSSVIGTSAGHLVDSTVADAWWNHRFAAPGLIERRNAEPGKLFDTIEVGVTWRFAAPLAAAIEHVLAPMAETVWLHASHAYPTGTCLYVAFWIEAPDDAAVVRRTQDVWDRVLAVSAEFGGTVAHHHGIGAARSGPYVASPEGRLHRAIKAALDPGSVLVARLLDGPEPNLAALGGSAP